MSSTATSSSITKAGRCGLTQEKLEKFNWVTEEGRCKALCEDGSKCGDPYSKHAAAPAGWSPGLLGVELNPGPCQGAVSEGKCEQGCTLTPEQVKGFKPDGICDCGHSYLRHGVLTAQSTGISMDEFFTTPEKHALKKLAAKGKDGSVKSPVSSFSRRQEKFKKKLLFRQAADSRPQHSCDICGQASANLTAAHVIPYAYRTAIYLEECVNRRAVGSSVHSPTDIHNGLLLCPSCDKGFESHDIDITSVGDIVITKNFLKKEGAKYTKLNGTKVRWANQIGITASPYPSQAVLEYRQSLPIPTSKEGRKLIKEFNEAAAKIGYNDQDFDEGEGEGEEAEEEEEEEGYRKKKKQKTGVGENQVKKSLKEAGFKEDEINSIMAAVPLSEFETLLNKARDKGRSLTREDNPLSGYTRRTENRMRALGWENQVKKCLKEAGSKEDEINSIMAAVFE